MHVLNIPLPENSSRKTCCFLRLPAPDTCEHGRSAEPDEVGGEEVAKGSNTLADDALSSAEQDDEGNEEENEEEGAEGSSTLS